MDRIDKNNYYLDIAETIADGVLLLLKMMK